MGDSDGGWWWSTAYGCRRCRRTPALAARRSEIRVAELGVLRGDLQQLGGGDECQRPLQAHPHGCHDNPGAQARIALNADAWVKDVKLQCRFMREAMSAFGMRRLGPGFPFWRSPAGA